MPQCGIPAVPPLHLHCVRVSRNISCYFSNSRYFITVFLHVYRHIRYMYHYILFAASLNSNPPPPTVLLPTVFSTFLTTNLNLSKVIINFNIVQLRHYINFYMLHFWTSYSPNSPNCFLPDVLVIYFSIVEPGTQM